MNQTKTSSLLEDLPNDLISGILSYCDFPTAVKLSRQTNKSLRARTNSGTMSHVWQAIFERYNFSPVEEAADHDYFIQCQKRRKLLQGLLKCDDRIYSYGRRDGDRKVQFHPITPSEQNVEVNDEDDADEAGVIQQDSFVCTSTSSGPGIAMMDPYDGSMSVISNYLASNDDEKVQTLHLQAEEESSPRQPANEVEKPQHLADGYVGIEAKPIIDFETNEVVADFLSTVRIIKTPSSLTDPISTELVTWTRPVGDATSYSDRMSRHIPGAFRLMDMDAKTQRVFISFQEKEESMRWMQWNATPAKNQVLAFSLLKQSQVNNSEEVPEPNFTIDCEDEVSAFSVDCTGEQLALATAKNTLEIWQVDQASASRLESISLKKALQTSIQTRLAFLKDLMKRQTVAQNSMDRRLNEPCILRRQIEKLALAPIQSIHLSKYSSIERSGFVTMHQDGRTLLHWRKVSGSYEIASMITNPLSTELMTQVEYTGTKVLLYGRNEDDSRVSVVVYHVASPDLPIADDWNKNGGKNGGGGVYNLCCPASIRFVNEIRPTAIRGIQAPKNTSPIHMTCNERFLVMNVMASEEWTGSSDLTQGLLVLDLEQ
mmetsp:Transcript_22438/g.55526  ORF Transcript_22438/g.55526 Transcript_22438/m.55526 type:complete len:599 (-) Transcript_22438:1317-3113(-)